MGFVSSDGNCLRAVLAERIKRDLIATFQKKGVDISIDNIDIKFGDYSVEVHIKEDSAG